MKTTLISNENNEATFALDFTAEEFEGAVNEVYAKNKKHFEVKGFRKGKAPRSMIEGQYGENIFFEDAVNTLLNKHYSDAAREIELEPISSPRVDIKEIGKQQPLSLEISVDLFPYMEVTGYDNLTIEQEKDEVTEADVNTEIQAMQKKNARLVSVDRPIEAGDTVILDFKGFIGKHQFEGGTAERQDLVIGSNTFIPGFEEQLIGVKAGESKDVNVTFPENYQETELAGKNALFKCDIHEVKVEELPELDDDFAMDVSEFDTLDELKEDIRKKMQDDKDESATIKAQSQLVNKLAEANDFEASEVMIENEIDQLISDFGNQLAGQGISLEMYCQYTNSTIEDLRGTMRDSAERNTKSKIVLKSIARQDNIEISEEEFNEEIQSLADNYRMDVETFKDAVGPDMVLQLRDEVILKKVAEMLYEKAEVILVDPPEPEEMPLITEEEAEEDAEE